VVIRVLSVSLRTANFLKKSPAGGKRALVDRDRPSGPHLFSAHTPPKERGRGGMRAKKNAGLRDSRQPADWAGAALPARDRRASILNGRSQAAR
jgi:hypothetical protein